MANIEQIPGSQTSGGWKNTLVKPHCMQPFPRAPWLAGGGGGMLGKADIWLCLSRIILTLPWRTRLSRMRTSAGTEYKGAATLAASKQNFKLILKSLTIC